jgi:DNA polymerase-1
MKKLFLIDAMALIFRAYYALNKNPRINSKGLNTSAILGFTNSLYDIIKNEKPTHIGVAFDSHGPTVRHVDFADYKANRDNTPEDIVASLPYIKEIIAAFGIPVLELSGYEADDIIGTLAKKAEQEGFTTFMMTTDKDYGQLVSENILIYKPAHMGNTHSIVGVKEVCEKYNIKNPEQLIDILGLWGDSVDNIPGVKGIGEVGSKKLIAEFGSIENLIANVDKVKNDKLREKIKQDSENALMSKLLATIILDVPIELDFSELEYTTPRVERLKAVFDELEFKTLTQRVFTDIDLQKSGVSIGKKPISDMGLFSSFEEVQPIDNKQNNHSIHTSEKNYVLIDTIKEIENLAKKLNICKSFCFDTETDGLDTLQCRLVGLAIAYKSKEAFYIHFPKEKEETMRWLTILAPVCENNNIEKIAQIFRTYYSNFHRLKGKFDA